MKTFAQKLATFRSLELARRRLEHLDREIPEQRSRVLQLQATLQREELDVKKLEGMNVTSIFQKFLGEYESRYALEKQEYVQAALEYNEGVRQLELLEFEANVLREKIEAGADLEEELRHLTRDREAAVRASHPLLATQLTALHQQEDELIGERREVYEAIIAGTKVLQLTSSMTEHLEAAAQYEEWSGGPYQRLQEQRKKRRRRVDEAHRESFRIRPALVKFSNELDDVNRLQLKRRPGAAVEFEFFDQLYYDRLITDWVLRQRIDHSLQFLRGIHGDVFRLVEGLKLKQRKSEQQLQYVRDRFQQILKGGS